MSTDACMERTEIISRDGANTDDVDASTAVARYNKRVAHSSGGDRCVRRPGGVNEPRGPGPGGRAAGRPGVHDVGRDCTPSARPLQHTHVDVSVGRRQPANQQRRRLAAAGVPESFVGAFVRWLPRSTLHDATAAWPAADPAAIECRAVARAARHASLL